MARPGHHYNNYSGMHVVRGLDDEGQAEWRVWSGDPTNGGQPVTGPLSTVQEAKAVADHRMRGDV
jgi:hypothetical protein